MPLFHLPQVVLFQRIAQRIAGKCGTTGMLFPDDLIDTFHQIIIKCHLNGFHINLINSYLYS